MSIENTHNTNAMHTHISKSADIIFYIIVALCLRTGNFDQMTFHVCDVAASDTPGDPGTKQYPVMECNLSMCILYATLSLNSSTTF